MSCHLKPSVSWCVLPFAETQVPLSHHVSFVAHLCQLLWQQPSVKCETSWLAGFDSSLLPANVERVHSSQQGCPAGTANLDIIIIEKLDFYG